MSFGSILQGLRKEAKVTQEDLAQNLGVSQRMIAACELGERRPSPGLAQRISAELGIRWTDFFEKEENE